LGLEFTAIFLWASAIIFRPDAHHCPVDAYLLIWWFTVLGWSIVGLVVMIAVGLHVYFRMRARVHT